MKFTQYLNDTRLKLRERVLPARMGFPKWPAKRQGALIFVLALLGFNAFGLIAYACLVRQREPSEFFWSFLACLGLGNLLTFIFSSWALRSMMGYLSRSESGAEWLERDYASLSIQVRDLSRISEEMVLFGQLSEMLQACANTQELCRIVTAFGKDLFPEESGALYLMQADQLILDSQASWGDPPSTAPFLPQDCWSIRRGKAHFWEGSHEGLFCAHVPHPLPTFSFCLPLTAQGGTLGLLHFRSGPAGKSMTEARRQVAIAFGYQIALGLSNLRLKENLHEEAIRDPVTGLYNRRFMEEALDHEIQRARRTGSSLGLIAFDLDHFKSVNDSLGHAAGDAVLRGLSAMAKRILRVGDISCRQGGDEFLLILPDISEVDCIRLAENLRNKAAQFMLEQYPALTGVVTLSCGVALFPQDAATAEKLQKAADEALYQAKLGGRDRVSAASALAGRNL
jgi:diguanylate cyclase (GGDEF)-like protein